MADGATAGLRLRGIKHGDPLGVLVLPGWPGPALTRLTQALAEAYINLPLVLLHPGAAPAVSHLAVDSGRQEDALGLAEQAGRELGLAPPRLRRAMVALTLYPLGGSLTLPAAVLACLARLDIHPLALGTSLSSLVMVLEQASLARARAALAQAFGLPDDADTAWSLRVIQEPGLREQD